MSKTTNVEPRPVRLSVIVVRPLLSGEERTTARALASLSGVADEVIFPTVAQTVKADGIKTRVVPVPYQDIERFYNLNAPLAHILPLSKLTSEEVLPGDLSALANIMSAAAEGDYVLLLDPADVCLDPTNIIRALDHLDASPHINVILCEVKVYDGDRYVRTVMSPKIWRRGKLELSGVLADNIKDRSDLSVLLAASGLTFRDTTGATVERSVFELKLLLMQYLRDQASAFDSFREDLARRLCDSRLRHVVNYWPIGRCLMCNEEYQGHLYECHLGREEVRQAIVLRPVYEPPKIENVGNVKDLIAKIDKA